MLPITNLVERHERQFEYKTNLLKFAKRLTGTFMSSNIHYLNMF